MKNVYTHSFKTGFGTIRTAATNRGLAVVTLPGETAAQFSRKVAQLFPDHEMRRGGRVNLSAEKQLRRYLDGRLKQFTLPLDIQGTPFHRKALKRVARIGYGQTMTYGQVAEAIGSPGAARAVGGANAGNNLPLVIPCHRVVAAGGLGGYGGGVAMKRRLLMMEGAL
ncbi:MAG: methylated-DNA--[protein]-cysteine S-methyltransferase [Candidatus Zixiibacteriota bacterium]|nr:MAG: methylated-DNA--[protein]-cysteine S-methyltransferase [candidate division Zixibacteria bacterium]